MGRVTGVKTKPCVVVCDEWVACCGEGHGGEGVPTLPASWTEVGTISVIHSRWSVPRIHGEGSDPKSRDR
jgi:hypothetical protein